MNKMKKMALAIVLLFAFFTTHSQVTINYVNPVGLTVCDSAVYEVTIQNNEPDSIKEVTVSIDLPSGITYIPGSVSNAAEGDISNLNVPVLSLANIASSEDLIFTITAKTDCSLIDNINSGSLFNNTITVNYQGGSQSTTTLPYIIETALLVITGTTNDILTATKGDIVTRTITIQNTRLGALTEFTFRDEHNGGIEITTNFGTETINTNTVYEVLLTSADFMMIGDGDALFELDESITITEEILIVDCGYDIDKTESEYLVEWGCGDALCQQTNSYAVIDLIPSVDDLEILFASFSDLPTNFCAEIPSHQGLVITNTGTSTAYDIFVEILQDTTSNIYGMDPNSFAVDSSGVSTPVNPILHEPIGFNGCSFAGILNQIAWYVIPALGPNESIILNWDTYICAEGCGTPILPWTYRYTYDLTCPEGNTFSGVGSSANDFPFFEVMTDTVTFSIGEVILDDGVYTLNYELTSNLLTDTVGTLLLDIYIPCGFKWVPTNQMILGGMAPFNTTITPAPPITIVTLEYDLPLSSTNVESDFQITFSCDAPCLPPEQWIENYITSCPPLEQCIGDTIYTDSMFVNTAILLDTVSSTECALYECQGFPLSYVCYLDEICDVYPPGYLDYDFDAYRSNYGLQDNNNDRLADNNNPPDLNLTRTDRSMPGDTITTIFDGSVIMDIPDSSFTQGTIQVTLSSHSIDDNIDNGFWLNMFDWAGLMGEDGIIPVDAVLRIFDASSGQTYECVLDPAQILYEQYGSAATPNTRPPEIIDEWISTIYTYNISPAALACLPPGFVYEAADNIQFKTRHKMVYNPQWQLNGVPMIINMRSSGVVSLRNPGENRFTCQCPSTGFQYSPYRYDIYNGNFGMLPCDTFTDPGNMGFRMVLGEGNFFPFEFRPLGKLEEWKVTFPPLVSLLESTLTSLELQDGPVLASNEMLNPDFVGGQYCYNVADYQDPIFDEGFIFRFDHLFETPCQVNSFQAVTVNAEIDFADNLPELVDPLDTTQIFGGAFYPVRPILALSTVLSNYTSYDNQAVWDISLANLPSNYPDPAEHVWLWIESPTGLIHDFQLINTMTGQPVTQINGIFQLGTFNVNQLNMYQLTAITSSCEEEVLIVHYGWGCDPYTNVNDTPCSQNFAELRVISPRGEIDMAVTSPITPVDLCDTIPYHTIEIFNAQLGAVFDVRLQADLPPGLIIVPGSSQLDYPSGSGFMAIGDPTDLGNGMFQWNISTLNTDIGDHGLSGINSMPDHSVSLRFLCVTECGFIAGSQIVFTSEAQQNCDEPTNISSKAGDPLLINGVLPPYEANLSIVADAPTDLSCGDELVLNVNMVADGATILGDSIFITLPPGVSYVPGSFANVNNAPLGEPNIKSPNGPQILCWGLPDGIPADNLITFEITTTGYGLTGCGENTILIQSVREQTALCVATGELCSVLAETGNTSLIINTMQPILDIQSFTGSYNMGLFSYVLQIGNTGLTTSSPVLVDFYLDNDGNGVLSAGDALIETLSVANIINNGSSIVVNGSLNLTIEEVCSLIAVIDDAGNCVCEADEIALQTPISATLPPVFACSETDTEIGLPGQAGHIYQWLPPTDLSCSNCADPVLNYENTTDFNVFLNYTLIDQSGNCEVNYDLIVTVYPEPGIVNEDETICPGETVTLNAENGTAFNWSGPGITDPGLPSQMVSPASSSTYNLTITDTNGCEGMDEVLVTVLPAPPVDAGDDAVFCEESTAFLNPDFNPNYTYSWLPAALLNDPGIYNPTIVQNIDTTYYLTITDLQGCENTDSVNISFDPGPELMISDDVEICNGETIELTVVGGTSYTWSPSVGIDCIDPECSMVEASPEETTLYTVTGENTLGCLSTTSVLVEVSLLPLEGESIVYYCEGDSVEVNGQWISTDTTFIENLISESGCDSIHQITVLESGYPDITLVDVPDDITVEEGDSVTIVLNPNFSYEWSPSAGLDCDTCSTVVASPDSTTIYSVEVINEGGCRATTEVLVTFFLMCSVDNVEIPNTFTPNGDGINDVFTPVMYEENLEEISTFEVWDRWGKKIFEGGGDFLEWDGTYKGQNAPSGVYIYIIRVQCDEGEDTLHGDITLIR